MSNRAAFVTSSLLLSAAALVAVGGCTSGADVPGGLSEEMLTLNQRPVDYGNSAKISYNENWKMFYSDWQRFWMIDRPSRLTPESMPR